MAGSSIGKLFVVTNFGESHGKAIGAVVDGCPPGMELNEEDIQVELDRRKPGTSRHVTQRKESDTVEILSGVYQGKTTGTPIALLIRNQDQKSKDYSAIENVFRPAHADWSYFRKYGIRDPRGGGRSSARLTAPTVAAGAIAKKWLKEQFGIRIRGCMINLGGIPLEVKDWSAVENNSFFCADPEKIPQLEAFMDNLRKACDSAGSEIYIEATGVTAGIGSPLYDRLDAQLAYAFMGLNAVKGVEIGDGFAVTNLKGSENADLMRKEAPNYLCSNHSGGILGGVSSGATITAKVAIKPTPSISQNLKTINTSLEDAEVFTKGRHDPCVGIRATPVLEALFALVLVDQILQQHAQCGW
ncbi:MAG: chorismate synthase [Klebsiella quasipneumoniae]|nr:chorismate synthase [Klebsiella quasipneumoniae]